LNISVSNPGLPDTLVGESYSCHFEDTLGRFENITVPAMEVTAGTAYTCDITNQVPRYAGIQAGRFGATVKQTYLVKEFASGWVKSRPILDTGVFVGCVKYEYGGTREPSVFNFLL
jgi:hypothetical protein